MILHNTKFKKYMKKFIILLLLILAMRNSAFSQTFTVVDVFDSVSKIDGFQEMEYVEDDMKFPSNIGTPNMIIHGNAEPREQVLRLLNKLPKGSLVYDSTDERGKFDRIFLDKSTCDLLFVHIGLGGNDSVLILFRGGMRKDIDKFLMTINSNTVE